MRVGAQDVRLPFGIVLDGWEVLLGGAIACIVVGVVAKNVRFLVWIGVGLIVLWVITVVLVNTGILPSRPRPKAGEGGGSSKAAG
jgi:hypothetical protein